MYKGTTGIAELDWVTRPFRAAICALPPEEASVEPIAADARSQGAA